MTKAQLHRVIRRNSWRMTRAERAIVVNTIVNEGLLPYIIAYRQNKSHRRVFGYDSYPIAFTYGEVKCKLICTGGRITIEFDR